MSDKRLGFFLVAALLCGGMTFLAPADLRWVPVVTAVTYVGLAILVSLESLGRRSGRHDE